MYLDLRKVYWQSVEKRMKAKYLYLFVPISNGVELILFLSLSIRVLDYICSLSKTQFDHHFRMNDPKGQML